MSALTQVRAGIVLAAEFGQAAYVALGTARNLRLITTNGTQATAGTELLAGGSYAAGGSAVTFKAPVAQVGTYSSLIQNNAWTQANMPASTIVGVEIWDTAATAIRVLWGALTASKTVAAGDTLSFPVDQLTGQI